MPAKKDMTNRQLLEAIEERLKGLATKEDLKEFATKGDLEQAITRLDRKLERKIDGNQTANIQHHLETKKAIAELNKEFLRFREGLAYAAGSLS